MCLISFSCSCVVVLPSLRRKTILSPLCCLCFTVRDHTCGPSYFGDLRLTQENQLSSGVQDWSGQQSDKSTLFVGPILALIFLSVTVLSPVRGCLTCLRVLFCFCYHLCARVAGDWKSEDSFQLAVDRLFPAHGPRHGTQVMPLPTKPSCHSPHSESEDQKMSVLRCTPLFQCWFDYFESFFSLQVNFRISLSISTKQLIGTLG